MASRKGQKRGPESWASEKRSKKTVGGSVAAGDAEVEADTIENHVPGRGDKSRVSSGSSHSTAVKDCHIPPDACKEVLDEYLALSAKNSLRTPSSLPSSSRPPSKPDTVGPSGVFRYTKSKSPYSTDNLTFVSEMPFLAPFQSAATMDLKIIYYVTSVCLLTQVPSRCGANDPSGMLLHPSNEHSFTVPQPGISGQTGVVTLKPLSLTAPLSVSINYPVQLNSTVLVLNLVKFNGSVEPRTQLCAVCSVSI